jgi:hypothetical protein
VAGSCENLLSSPEEIEMFFYAKTKYAIDLEGSAHSADQGKCDYL